jgi:hypothetical protein
MAEWAKGQGDAQRQKEVLDEARAEARKGTEAFTAWWKANEGKRAIAKTIVADLQAACAEADREAAADQADPFGLPPLDRANTATDTELTDAMREEMAEQARREVEEQARAAGAA